MPEPTVDPVNSDVEALEPDAVGAWDELFAVADAAAQMEEAVPPPSNAVLDVVFGHGVCSGLNPGGLSSVAPSGIPLETEEDDAPEDIVPSGEVAPMPGV